LTILKKKTCLGSWSTCGGDPAVPLHLRNTTDYRLPTFGPHGTKLGHSWLQWIKKSDFLSGLTILKKERRLGSWSTCGGDPACTLQPRNTAEYRLSNFTTTWHQTRAFLIAVNIEKWCNGWFDNTEKGDVSGQLERLRGWSCGCTSPQEHCQLPPTYFWTTWHQNRAFLIVVNNKKWCGRLVWQFWKRRCVWAVGALAGVILWIHFISGTLQPTAYLLLDHMAPN